MTKRCNLGGLISRELSPAFGSDDVVREMAIPVSWELQWHCSVARSRSPQISLPCCWWGR